MTSVQELIGLHQGGTHASTSKLQTGYLATDKRVGPDDYPAFAERARELGSDIRTAYTDALEQTEREERVQDRYFLERAKEFVELNDQIGTSAGLLTDLSSFLSTFQSDLSAVSGHISELQERSRSIEQRLEARKAVERSLHPFLDSITISPSLITTISDATDVNSAYISAVIELDAKLGAIRSGPRVEGRKNLDTVAEALRLKATSKILLHLTSLLKPYTLSVTLPIEALQTKLVPLKPLFDFLRRHSARQAHDFQKAYTQTARWYYETAFRRYVRSLESVRMKGVVKGELIGTVASGVDGSLALLRKAGSASPATPKPPPAGNDSTLAALENSEVEGPPLITAYAITAGKLPRPAPEALFRSISLVFADNTRSEYAFLMTFFGTHSTLSVPEARTPSLFSASASSVSQPSSRAPSEAGALSAVDGAEAIQATRENKVPGKEGVAGSVRSTNAGADEKSDKMARAVVEGLWKSVMEPAQEYTQNFAFALLDSTSPPGPLSLLAMTRLNETLFKRMVLGSPSADATPKPSDPARNSASCPALDSHLITMRMQLYPAFTTSMNAQVDSVKRINGSMPAGGLFGGKSSGSDVKDSVVSVVVQRYAELFAAFVQLSDEGDEELMFSSLRRLRQEVDKLLTYQASKIADKGKQRGFLLAHYEELLRALSNGLSSHSRSQAEVAHWREMSRRAGAG